MSCLGDNTIGAFVEGKLAAKEARQVREHLAQCEECRSLVRAVVGHTARSDALTGQLLAGTYRVKHLVGNGAMGVVYAGEHVRLTRPVAIKILGEALRHHPDALERFRREAQICSRLGNSHIVDVLDFNTLPDGTPFMVMELLQGEDLAQRLAIDGRMTPAVLVPIMRQICSALATAHDEGVLHRDLKPSNVFLCPGDDGRPQVKVLDFGISKVRGALATLTGSQEILGTPYYMSPEMAQARHADVDQRSDLFSLGAIAYEALTGRLAFDADSIPGALYRIVHEEPEPIDQVSPSTPPPLARLVTALLSKDRAQRPESARTVMDQLMAIRSSTGQLPLTDPYAGTQIAPVADTVKPRGSLRLARLVLLVSLVLVGGSLGAWLVWPRSTDVPPTSEVPPTPATPTRGVPDAALDRQPAATMNSASHVDATARPAPPPKLRPRPRPGPRQPAPKKPAPKKPREDRDPIL